jgi:uncharacterized membrane protein YsdA (DUF1294 family)
VSTGLFAALCAGAAWLLLLLWSLHLGYLAEPWLWLLLLLNLLSFLLYRNDKRAAIRGERRTPENTLHLLALLGGWPAALLAQQLLRHKTSKFPFRIVFWFTVLVNGSILTWLHSTEGRPLLQGLNRHIEPAASLLVSEAGHLTDKLLVSLRNFLRYLEQQI